MIFQKENTATGAHLLDIATTVVEGVGLENLKAGLAKTSLSLLMKVKNKSRPLSLNTMMVAPAQEFMLAWDDWKLVYYVGMQPQLFNLGEDPQEKHDLALNPAFAEIIEIGKAHLKAICDPEVVSAKAFEDQRRMIEKTWRGRCHTKHNQFRCNTNAPINMTTL